MLMGKIMSCVQDDETALINKLDEGPEYSLKGLVLKLKLQYFGHLMQRVDSLEKTLMLGKIEDRRRRGRQRMRWLDGIINSVQTLGDGEGQGGLVCCTQHMGLQRVGHD